MNTKTLINAGKMTLLVNARQIEQNDRKGNEIKWRREKMFHLVRELIAKQNDKYQKFVKRRQNERKKSKSNRVR